MGIFGARLAGAGYVEIRAAVRWAPQPTPPRGRCANGRRDVPAAGSSRGEATDRTEALDKACEFVRGGTRLGIDVDIETREAETTSSMSI